MTGPEMVPPGRRLWGANALRTRDPPCQTSRMERSPCEENISGNAALSNRRKSSTGSAGCRRVCGWSAPDPRVLTMAYGSGRPRISTDGKRGDRVIATEGTRASRIRSRAPRHHAWMQSQGAGFGCFACNTRRCRFRWRSKHLDPRSPPGGKNVRASTCINKMFPDRSPAILVEYDVRIPPSAIMASRYA